LLLCDEQFGKLAQHNDACAKETPIAMFVM